MLEYVGYRNGERFERWRSDFSVYLYVMTSGSAIAGGRYLLSCH